MYQSFESLPEDKRNKIIDACIEEFGQKGYEKASTNAIVKKAGISKGIIFHYFGNKKSLFLYIFDYVFDFFIKEFYKTDLTSHHDIFDRLIERGLRKIKISYEYPAMYKFIMEAVLNTPDELKADIKLRYNKLYSEGMPEFLKDIDVSKFRKDIDPNMGIEFILLCLESLSNKYINKFQGQADLGLTQMEKILEDNKKYIDIIKYGIYEKPSQ